MNKHSPTTPPVDGDESPWQLEGADAALLAAYRFDEAGHARLVAAVRSGALGPAASVYRGHIDPPKQGDVPTLPPVGSPDEEQLRALGEAALRKGEVAVVVLAGGMATRFQGAPGIKLEPGEQVVKGTVDVVDGRSFIALKLEDTRRASRRYGGWIAFCVMGSFSTLKGRNGLERHLADTGLMADDVRLFSQSISLRVTPRGDIFGADGAQPLPTASYTTPGHGDFFLAIKDSGLLDELLARGVKTIMFSNVDNLGATIDPRIIGHFLAQKAEHGTAMLAETVERTAEDGAKTGTVVYADGRFRILEGFRIADEVANALHLPEVSINTFYFDAAKLKQAIPLDVHAVKKVVDGKDAIQFETVTCEATGALAADGKPLLPLAVLRVPRAGAPGRFHDGRFYPVKTPDDLDHVRTLLRASALTDVAGDHESKLARLDAALAARFDGAGLGQRRYFWSPGRINIIGEHVDHQGGIALPAAVQLGVLLASQARADDQVMLYSSNLEELVSFSLKDNSIAGDKSWGRYAKAVVAALAEHGVKAKGMQAVLESTLPPGSGMSSSAALCLALVKAFISHAGVTLTQRELVLLAQRAEHIVGVHCGNMDQAAIVHGRKGHAVLLDCRTLETELLPLALVDHVFVVGDTRKNRGLVDSEYNARRAECEGAVAVLRRLTGRPLDTLRDVLIEDLAQHGAALSPAHHARARHVVEEIARVRTFAAQLTNPSAGSEARLGELLNESHRSLRDLFEVSCPELNTMVDLSRAYRRAGADGALVDAVAGSRMMGGGFGGCTLSLVRSEEVDGFVKHVGPAYESRTGLVPAFYRVEPGDGLSEVG